MADAAARVAQLEAELHQLRDRYGASRDENVALREQNVVLSTERSEAVDQQLALADILHRMVAAPGDSEAVLGVIAEHATRIGRAVDAQILRREGNQVFYAAHFGPLITGSALHTSWPLKDRRIANAVILEGRTIHAPDILIETQARYPESVENARQAGMTEDRRTWLGVPLRAGANVIGALVLRRATIAPFSDRELAIVQSFAAEAALAIENARLFEEVERRNADLQDSNRRVTEALEQQTATAEVLRVIAASPTDLDRVLAAVAESAARLCEINDVVIFGIERGHVVRIAAVGTMPSPPPRTLIPLNRQTIQGRAIIDRCPVHVPDVQAVLEAEYPISAPLSRRHGTRSALAVPLLREGAAVGAIYARRDRLRPFTEQQIALLETFADQAVIAIENARLFEELEQRNKDLGEALSTVTQ